MLERRLRDVPIARKLTIILLIVSGTAVLAAGSAFVGLSYIFARRAHDREMGVVSEVISDQCLAALEFRQPEQAAEILRALKAERQIVTAVLYGADGRSFARYLREGAGTAAAPPAPPPPGESEGGGDFLLVRPMMSGEERIGTFLLRSDRAYVLARMRANMASTAIVMVGALLGAMALTGRLARHVARPVESLLGVMQRIVAGREYGVRAEPAGRDEMGRLVMVFNEMLAQIQARDEALARARGKLEQRVQERTKELAALNKELEGFSYSVSHDLRAPLRAVDGYARMLQEDCAGQVDATGKRYIGVIQDNARKMGQLIDDLLSFARMGRKSMESSRIDMAAMARAASEELSAANPGRRIEWRIGDLPAAMGDPPMMQQVWVNLLSNAVKYTRGREPAVIEVQGTGGAEGARYVVRDNGVGFDMEYASKLFGVFQRLHSAAEFEGTGVGLALVQRVVHRHGGTVGADSKVGEGATFWFSLPEASSARPRAAREETGKAPSGPGI